MDQVSAIFLSPDFLPQNLTFKLWKFFEKHQIMIVAVLPLIIQDRDVSFLYEENVKVSSKRNPNSAWLSMRLFQSGITFLVLLKSKLNQQELKSLQGSSTETSYDTPFMRGLSALTGRCFSVVHVPDHEQSLNREVGYFLGEQWMKIVIEKPFIRDFSDFNTLIGSQSLSEISCPQQILPKVILKTLLFLKYHPLIPKISAILDGIIETQKHFTFSTFEIRYYFERNYKTRIETKTLIGQLLKEINQASYDFRILKKRYNCVLLIQMLGAFLLTQEPDVHLSEELLDIIKMNHILISPMEAQLFSATVAFMNDQMNTIAKN